MKARDKNCEFKFTACGEKSAMPDGCYSPSVAFGRKKPLPARPSMSDTPKKESSQDKREAGASSDEEDGGASEVTTPSGSTPGPRGRAGSDSSTEGARSAGAGSSKPSTTTSAAGGDEEPLLEGWAEYVDITSERPMWFHAASKGTTWLRPTASNPPKLKGEWMQMWYVPSRCLCVDAARDGWRGCLAVYCA